MTTSEALAIKDAALLMALEELEQWALLALESETVEPLPPGITVRSRAIDSCRAAIAANPL